MTIARWKDLCIDATDPHRVDAFWATALGLRHERDDDGDSCLRGSDPEQTIWINAVPEPRTVKQRVHLDLEARALEPLLALGATVVQRASESGVHWDALVDPEGGELCVFVRDHAPAEPPARIYEMVVDTADAACSHAQAAWWADVIGGVVVDDDRGFSWLEQVPGLPFESIDFVPVTEPKTVKNRIHWDIECDDVTALLERGATVLAEPTETTAWHVCADPEGNEFCVFAP